MPFILDRVVPWGRSFDEYVAMFALSPAALRGKILGCGDGPASFNAGIAESGGSAVSADPICQFSAEHVSARIDETYAAVMAQTRRNRHEFVWVRIHSVDELGRVRMAAMQQFLADYDQGRREGRNLPASLPSLPFRGRAFDLALCSHFLLLYSEQLSLAFHMASIREMLRVSHEVRVFPLLELGAVRSLHLTKVLAALARVGCEASVERVLYEFQRGGNEVLRVRAVST